MIVSSSASWVLLLLLSSGNALVSPSFLRPSSSSSAFLGTALVVENPARYHDDDEDESSTSFPACHYRIRRSLTMRKQKASDRRTRRRQRGDDQQRLLEQQQQGTAATTTTFTVSPMQSATWNHKQQRSGDAVSQGLLGQQQQQAKTAGGRGRSRKRTALYQTLAHYHNRFLQQLTAEYQAEEDEVLGRIKASLEDPLGLEQSGFCFLDMYAERRGNLFQEEVYRLTKAADATTVQEAGDQTLLLPPNHKFSTNDVIVMTQQPRGSGDFFTAQSLPVTDTAVKAEARVLNLGPTYVDVAMSGGAFEAAFGVAANDVSNRGNRQLRLRVDRFVSNIPYQRMVAALSQLTAVPSVVSKNRSRDASTKAAAASSKNTATAAPGIVTDETLKELILSTYAYADPSSLSFHDADACHIEELSNKVSKPPMATSPKLARQVLKYIQSNPNNVFRQFNAPQKAAIEAALTRRMTLIQGPPGTGKTCVAAIVGVGFVHQCRSISEHTKVLACAFSNVGADNLAEAMVQLGLKVVRIGKASAVAEPLWSYTLDAAIDRDPTAQKALQNAAKATAQLSKLNKRSSESKGSSNNSKLSLSDRNIRDAATAAVKASIEASNIAATKALREADVIVATSTGAADPRLLAACGIVNGSDDSSPSSYMMEGKKTATTPLVGERVNAPDGFSPLSLPFVLVDEACQSVEPATLIPIVSSNSCRALVMLGDPCQLPPTIRSRQAESLAVSLMERLAATLPHPSVIPSVDNTAKDSTYLDALPVKQAISLVDARSEGRKQQSYRKLFSGSLLLSIQYRMHPSIAALPSAIFYGGLLSTPDFMRDIRSFPRALSQSMPCGTPNLCVRLVDVGGQDNERQGTPSKYTNTVFSSSAASTSSLLEQQTTYWNEAEAERVLALLKNLVSGGPDPNVSSVGIISPYNGQVQLIKSMIANDVELRDMLREMAISIEVKSVDGYQGRERDVIIFSAVRSNRQERIGFLHDWRRMNVAMTRAKSGLVMIGDFDTLSAANKHWGALTKWAEGVRCIVDDYDHPEDEVST